MLSWPTPSASSSFQNCPSVVSRSLPSLTPALWLLQLCPPGPLPLLTPPRPPFPRPSPPGSPITNSVTLPYRHLGSSHRATSSELPYPVHRFHLFWAVCTRASSRGPWNKTGALGLRLHTVTSLRVTLQLVLGICSTFSVLHQSQPTVAHGVRIYRKKARLSGLAQLKLELFKGPPSWFQRPCLQPGGQHTTQTWADSPTRGGAVGGGRRAVPG